MSKRLRLNLLDGRLAERAAAISEGRAAPAPPRDAATVIVARPSGHGTEILMLKRPGSMAFAAGAYVFPGGSVDAADADPAIGWRGPPPEEFGARLGAAPELARALVVAAARETFEESGVLLAGPAGPPGPGGSPRGAPVAVAGPGWERDRAALNSGELSFAALLGRRGLAVLADRLIPWARWITPEAEPKRFDARFFAALMPPGQAIAAHETEADHLAWIEPSAALASARAGEITLLTPTAVILGEFARAGDLAAALAARRAITPVQPRVVAEGGQAWLEIPDEVVYPL